MTHNTVEKFSENVFKRTSTNWSVSKTARE